MARHFKTPDYIHSNRIHRLEKTEKSFRLGYEEKPLKRKKKYASQPSRHFSFVSALKIGQRIITNLFGECIVREIDDSTGHQVIQVAVKGNAGYRRETIFPLHIKQILK